MSSKTIHSSKFQSDSDDLILLSLGPGLFFTKTQPLGPWAKHVDRIQTVHHFTMTSLSVTHPCAEGGIRRAPMWNLQQNWQGMAPASKPETHLPNRIFHGQCWFYEGNHHEILQALEVFFGRGTTQEAVFFLCTAKVVRQP